MSPRRHMSSHLKLVAKISIAVSVLAVFVLSAVLATISGDSGQSYGEIIRQHGLTRKHLGVAMLVAGLLLVAITGLITTLIVYYTSFRVAGPLYRFSQNLKLACADEKAPLPGLRRGDPLVEQAAAVEHAVGTLRAHYRAVEAAAQAAGRALAAGDQAAYASALAQLKALDAKARL